MKNIAVIGAGEMGRVRAQAVVAAQNARLVAVTSRSLASSKRLADDLNVPSVVVHYTELEELDLDAVIVTTPPCFHYEITKWALRLQLDALVEAPLCFSVSEGQELLDLEHMTGAIVEIGYNDRYNPLWDKAKQLIENQELGDPILAYTTGMINIKRLPSWYFSEEISGGIYLAHGCYVFDGIRWLLGNPSTLVSTAHEKSLVESSLTKDTITLTFTFPSGALALIAATYIAPDAFPGEGVKIICSEGSLHIEDERRLHIYNQRETQIVELPNTTPHSTALQVHAFIEQIHTRERGRNPITDAIIDPKIARAIARSLETESITAI